MVLSFLCNAGTPWGFWGPHFPLASRCPVRITPWGQRRETGSLAEETERLPIRVGITLVSSPQQGRGNLLQWLPLTSLCSFLHNHSANLRTPSSQTPAPAKQSFNNSHLLFAPPALELLAVCCFCPL